MIVYFLFRHSQKYSVSIPCAPSLNVIIELTVCLSKIKCTVTCIKRSLKCIIKYNYNWVDCSFFKQNLAFKKKMCDKWKKV